MDRDWVERDRLLTEVHSNVSHLVTWAKEHTAEDDTRFKEVKADIELGKKVLYGALGIFVAVEFLAKLIN